jgi:hypothetical protein
VFVQSNASIVAMTQRSRLGNTPLYLTYIAPSLQAHVHCIRTTFIFSSFPLAPHTRLSISRWFRVSCYPTATFPPDTTYSFLSAAQNGALTPAIISSTNPLPALILNPQHNSTASPTHATCVPRTNASTLTTSATSRAVLADKLAALTRGSTLRATMIDEIYDLTRTGVRDAVESCCSMWKGMGG